MKTAIASILLSGAHGALAAPQAPGAAPLQFPGCQANLCYGGIDRAFGGNKTLIADYCTLYSTSQNFAQRSTDIISNCALTALDNDPCQCASGGDDSGCWDERCYDTISRVFGGKKSHLSAYCSLRDTIHSGEIEDKLFGFDTCMKTYNETWGSGWAVDFKAIGRACDCVGRG